MPTLKKILYVEDDLALQSTTKFVIEALCDFEVMTCESGQSLIDCANEYQPDLILLDVSTSKPFFVLNKLQFREKVKNIPVIFITTELDDKQLEDLREFGAIGVIKKPFEALELCESIKKIWCKNLEDATLDPLNCCKEIENIWRCDID